MLNSLCGVQCERAGFVMVLGPHEGESLIELFNRQSPVAAFAVVGCTHVMHWAAPAASFPAGKEDQAVRWLLLAVFQLSVMRVC